MVPSPAPDRNLHRQLQGDGIMIVPFTFEPHIMVGHGLYLHGLAVESDASRFAPRRDAKIQRKADGLVGSERELNAVRERILSLLRDADLLAVTHPHSHFRGAIERGANTVIGSRHPKIPVEVRPAVRMIVLAA